MNYFEELYSIVKIWFIPAQQGTHVAFSIIWVPPDLYIIKRVIKLLYHALIFQSRSVVKIQACEGNYLYDPSITYLTQMG